ncbi:MAG: S9 family peptidase, partial [Nitrospirae bacterium]
MKRISCIVFLLLVFFTSVHAQEAAIPPGDNLVVEGIPRVSATLVEAVSRYTEFRRAAFLSWHPSKREMLVRTRFAETVQVHQVQFPGGARTQLTFFSDPVHGASYPPKDARWFVFSKDTGGDEFYQFYRYDLGTSDVTLLTDGKSRNTSAVFSNSGERLAYSSTRRNG